MRKDWERFRNLMLWAIPIVVAIGIFLVPFITNRYKEAVQDVEAKMEDLEVKLERVKSLETKLDVLIDLKGLSLNHVDGYEGANRQSIEMLENDIKNSE